jgi:hypothetical protein
MPKNEKIMAPDEQAQQHEVRASITEYGVQRERQHRQNHNGNHRNVGIATKETETTSQVVYLHKSEE